MTEQPFAAFSSPTEIPHHSGQAKHRSLRLSSLGELRCHAETRRPTPSRAEASRLDGGDGGAGGGAPGAFFAFGVDPSEQVVSCFAGVFGGEGDHVWKPSPQADQIVVGWVYRIGFADQQQVFISRRTLAQ